MSDLTPDQKKRATEYLMSFPGLRGRDVPEHIYDRIKPVADGIAMQTWGRPATPHQIQHLHDNEAHTPAAIHEHFGRLQHPYAPGLTLSEYGLHHEALQQFRRHGGQL